MNANSHLEDFLTRLGHAATVAETWGETLAFLNSQGFEFVHYGFGDPSVTDGDAFHLLSNIQPGYADLYREKGYQDHDPALLHCLTALTPCRMGINAYDLSRLNAVQRDLIQEAAEFGLKSGLVFPMRSAGRYPIAGMSVSNAMKGAEFDRFMEERELMIHLAVMHAHTRMQMQMAEEKAVAIRLTRRERECLLWTGKGLSSKEIARRLGVSPKAVDFHIANAMTKLAAATRAHAVAVATSLGLIAP